MNLEIESLFQMFESCYSANDIEWKDDKTEADEWLNENLMIQ